MASKVSDEAESVRLAKYAGRPRLGAIVWFRAIAILLIVAGHSYHLAGVSLVTGIDSIVFNIIHGATALFVFLSGYIFDYVFSARYNYWRFVIDRARKLLIPFCVLTILAGFMFSNWASGGISSDQIFRYFVFGDAFQAYWYIPFILLMFSLAPLHRLFMDIRISHQATIIIVGAILGSLVHRPIGNDNAFQSVVFYMPIYLSGLFLSLHREMLMPVLKKNWFLFLLAAVIFAVIQSAVDQRGNMHKSFFEIDGVELMGFQKLAISLALFSFFARFSFSPGLIVRIIADTSFAVFFLHPFVLKLLGSTTFFKLTPLPWINLAIVIAAIVGFCAFVALAMRAALKSNSKYLIGY